MANAGKSAAEICDAIEAYTANTATGSALGYLNDGYDRGLLGIHPRTLAVHEWSFLRPTTTDFVLWATTTTGAATISGGSNTTLTVSAATFYESMVGATITSVTLGTSYTISSYTSSKIITLSADASLDTGDTFTITATGVYQLPAAFGGLITPPFYQYVSGVSFPDLTEKPIETIYRWYREHTTGDEDEPFWYTIIPRDFDSSVGQRWDIYCAPLTETTRTITMLYRPLRATLTDSGTIFLLGGQPYSQFWQAMGLAEAEEQIGKGKPGPWQAKAERLMASMIDLDSRWFADGDTDESLTDIDTGLGD